MLKKSGALPRSSFTLALTLTLAPEKGGTAASIYMGIGCLISAQNGGEIRFQINSEIRQFPRHLSTVYCTSVVRKSFGYVVLATGSTRAGSPYSVWDRAWNLRQIVENFVCGGKRGWHVA